MYLNINYYIIIFFQLVSYFITFLSPNFIITFKSIIKILNFIIITK